jgi:TetR/AcrR family fatty acid metabolism transcriptional regulator
LFSTKGLYEARVEDLAAAAGIAKGTIYGYFADKDELVRAVVEAGYRELLLEVRSAAGPVRGQRARITAIVLAHARFFHERPDLLRVFHQARGMLKFNRRAWRPLRSSLEQHVEGLADLLSEGAQAELPRRLFREQARMLFGALSGAISVHVALEPAGSEALLEPRAVRAITELAMTFERDVRNTQRRRARATG